MVAAPDEQQAPKRQRLALLSHESASGGGDSADLDRLESEPSDDEGEGEYEGEWSGSWEGCVDDLELSHEIYATQAVWEAREVALAQMTTEQRQQLTRLVRLHALLTTPPPRRVSANAARSAFVAAH